MAENNHMSKKKLMRQLQELEFAIIETGLYLDGHPNCKKALAYYNQMKEKRNAVREKYETMYGPLTIFANNSNDTWHWVKTAWPWELED